jgi:hypothetical protein
MNRLDHPPLPAGCELLRTAIHGYGYGCVLVKPGGGRRRGLSLPPPPAAAALVATAVVVATGIGVPPGETATGVGVVASVVVATTKA